jgi:hypothetical protein
MSDEARVRKVVSDKASLHDAYRSVFENPKGRMVLKHLCREGHVLSSTFVAGDPYQSALNEGERRIVLSILKFINKNPDELLRQIEEEYQRDT